MRTISYMRGAARTLAAVLATAGALLLGACDDDDDDAAGADTTRFVFGMESDAGNSQDFAAETSDPAVIEAARAQLALPVAERSLFISGPIERGDGGHNEPWSWHFVPGEWGLVEVAIELCDGNPVLVEQSIDYWVDTVGQFCPWGSYVKAEEP